MKTLIILMASVMPLFSDVEIRSSLPGHFQRTEQVAIDSGKWSVDVIPDSTDADITCTYSHIGEVLLKQEHVSRCHVATAEVLPAYIAVNIVNNSDKMLGYTVHSFESTNSK